MLVWQMLVQYEPLHLWCSSSQTWGKMICFFNVYLCVIQPPVIKCQRSTFIYNIQGLHVISVLHFMKLITFLTLSALVANSQPLSNISFSSCPTKKNTVRPRLYDHAFVRKHVHINVWHRSLFPVWSMQHGVPVCAMFMCHINKSRTSQTWKCPKHKKVIFAEYPRVEE